jgi:hypothetical protein
MPIKLSLITAHDCELAKAFTLSGAGKLESSAIAHMTQGAAQVIEINDLDDLDETLRSLAPNQAITCGVPRIGDTPLTTRSGTEFNPHAVARTNEAFHYRPGVPALFPIDVDVDADSYASVEEVLDDLESCSDWLKDCVRVARPSSSSYVGGRGLRGVHVYLAISNGADTTALGQRLQLEQWRRGRGFVKISKSGALLVRQLSDALVYQPSRLMFEAAPVLGEGVSRVVPEGQEFVSRGVYGGAGRPPRCRDENGFLIVGNLPAIRDIEWRKFEVAKKQAKDARRLEAKRVAINYQAQMAADAGLTPEEGGMLGARAIRALDDKKLPQDWPLAVMTPEGRVDVTVAQVFELGEAAFGYSCADPFESHDPTLTRAQMSKAEIVSMGGKVGVWSHKLQQFFTFADNRTSTIETPLQAAVERLAGTIEDWPDARDKKRSSYANVTHACRVLAVESGDYPRYNAATDAIETPDGATETDYLEALARLGCTGVTKGAVKDAHKVVARTHQYDPWLDRANSLPRWDGVERLDTYLTDYLEMVAPSEMHKVVTQAFFAGMLMRQLHPGAPANPCPVLIGPQGKGKGTFVKGLSNFWGRPSALEINFEHADRETTMTARMSPIVEIAEMAGVARKEVASIKMWMTAESDNYRAPYDERPADHPRRFTPIGTANIHELNMDETGNRRFAPFSMERTEAPEPGWDIELPQVFAEAKERFCKDLKTYGNLVRQAGILTFEYNMQDAARGVGVPESPLDELLPPILLKHLRANENGKVHAGEILRTLDSGPMLGRTHPAKMVSKWLRTRGWIASKDGIGRRTYRAPALWLETAASELEVVPMTNNPFTLVK